MDTFDDGIDRAGLYARWFKRADGATGEVLTSVPLEEMPAAFAGWEELETEAEYLAALEAVENHVEDSRREVKVGEAQRAAAELTEWTKAKVPASLITRLTGFASADDAAAALEQAKAYTDPSRRTKRKSPPVVV